MDFIITVLLISLIHGYNTLEQPWSVLCLTLAIVLFVLYMLMKFVAGINETDKKK